MNKETSIRAGIVAGAFVLALGLTFVLPNMKFGNLVGNVNADVEEDSVLGQEILGILNNPIEIIKVYDSGKLIGIVHDYSSIENLLNRVYSEGYKDEFPDTKMGLGEDIYLSRELSSFEYENKDFEICEYLRQNDRFAIETNSIEFSDDNGVYATIYVKNIEDFNTARDRYLRNFVSDETLSYVSKNQSTPELTTYGRRELNVNIMENMTVSTALVSPSKVMKSMEEVLSYLCYGENAEPEIYVVEEFDTVEGVGSKNNGLTAEQVVTINPGVLSSVDQVLEVGMELNVRYFDSPINVVVTQELITQEVVYPDSPLYKEDPTMREGATAVSVQEANGRKNVKYQETWINGVLVSGEEVSSIITQAATQGVILYGTKIIPGVGTGSFRWPVDNPRVSCSWYCYSGHRATDIQNAYNRYGNIYAADRGTVEVNSYHRINGYYMIINHNNGYKTYYGHMNRPGFIGVGQNVEKGEVIGQIGMTGVATGPHVHFYIEYNGTRSNPVKYLP